MSACSPLIKLQRQRNRAAIAEDRPGPHSIPPAGDGGDAKHLSKAYGVTKHLLEAALKGVEEVLMDQRFSSLIRGKGVQRTLAALIERIFLAVAGIFGQNPTAVQLTSNTLKGRELPINLRTAQRSSVLAMRSQIALQDHQRDFRYGQKPNNYSNARFQPAKGGKREADGRRDERGALQIPHHRESAEYVGDDAQYEFLSLCTINDTPEKDVQSTLAPRQTSREECRTRDSNPAPKLYAD